MKKGFTLIELLAVIVILAVIALIATPIILNIVEDSKKSAATNSAQLYADGLTKQIATKNLTREFNPSSCTILKGVITCDGETLNYKLSGTKPNSGSITFNNGVITEYTLCISGYKIVKNGNDITTTKDPSCIVEDAVYSTPGLYRNGTMVYTWQELIDEGLIVIEHDYTGWDGTSNRAFDNAIVYARDLNGYLYMDDSIDFIAFEAFSPYYEDIEKRQAAGLTGIRLSENLESISGLAFVSNDITSLTIPASVIFIDTEFSFGGNPLERIIVDSNNPVYDSRDNCNAIIETSTNMLVQGSKNTIIPNTVTSILLGSFEAIGLTSINIPANVEQIGVEAFSWNPLTSITVDPNNPVYDSRNNCNAIIETATNTLIAGTLNTVIPNSVTSIGTAAFAGVGISSVTIPNSVEYIGEIAFFETNLTSVTIPSSVETIANSAFSSNKLTSVTISNGVELIDTDAFDSNQISSINIPSSVTTIGYLAFGNNPLTSITVDSNNPVYDSRNNCNAIIKTATNEIVQGSRNTVIPNTVTKISEHAFYGVGVASITIPTSVTTIDNYSFKNNSLTNLTIPGNVAQIGWSAFEDNQISSLTLSNGITNIGSSAFEGNRISSLSIPASVRYMQFNAFARNPLTSITVDSSNPAYDSRNNCNAIIETGANRIITGSRNTVITSDIREISTFAFHGVGITSMTIPSNVVRLEYNVFMDNQLTNVTFENINNWHKYCQDGTDVSVSTSLISTPQSAASYINSNKNCGYVVRK